MRTPEMTMRRRRLIEAVRSRRQPSNPYAAPPAPASPMPLPNDGGTSQQPERMIPEGLTPEARSPFSSPFEQRPSAPANPTLMDQLREALMNAKKNAGSYPTAAMPTDDPYGGYNNHW